ncbi:MAG: hypothetical protein U1E76_01110 [Planctomycetota bacterium]
MAATHGNGKELSNLSAVFLEGLYAEFLRDPAAVGEDWRRYFGSLAASVQRSPRT